MVLSFKRLQAQVGCEIIRVRLVVIFRPDPEAVVVLEAVAFDVDEQSASPAPGILARPDSMEQHDRRARPNDDGVALARRAARRPGEGRGGGNQTPAPFCLLPAGGPQNERGPPAGEPLLLIFW